MRPPYLTALLFFLFMGTNELLSQNMTNEKLEKIVRSMADSIQGSPGNWQFLVKDRMFICVTDQQNNRMRIMSPVIEQKKLAYTDMLKLMEANFHTALDVKYAIAHDLLWSVYIHPLRELSDDQLVDAIQQVYVAAMTYGSTYSSSSLSFPDRNKEKRTQKNL